MTHEYAESSGLAENQLEEVTAQNRRGVIPGEIAIWVLIFAELFEFAFFFILFIIAKAHNPEIFAQGSRVRSGLFIPFWQASLIFVLRLGNIKQMHRVVSMLKLTYSSRPITI